MSSLIPCSSNIYLKKSLSYASHSFLESVSVGLMLHNFDSLPSHVKMECFGYLSIEDMGKVSQLSHEVQADALSDCVWRRLYPATFTRARDAIPVDVQNLVNRPYRRNSVGWSVSVLQDNSDTWLTGVVLDYRNEKFLVRYDVDDREAWERETMTGGAWFVAGKLRIKFHSPPEEEHKLLLQSSRAPSASESENFSFPIKSEDEVRAKRKTSKRSPIRTCISDSSSSSSSGCTPESPGAHSWRCEAFRDRTMAPTKLLTELQVHADEVLCVSFSNKSNRLASCSRDGTTQIHDLREKKEKNGFSINPSSIVIRHPGGEVPCRVSWSPDDSLILVSTEAKNGNVFDYDASVACYDSFTGSFLFKQPNIPFDVCAAWIPGTKIFIHGEFLSVSPRGTYHQVLSLFDCGSMKRVGRFHFRFVNEAFIHLIQVSPDGNFLAVTCGLGDALSDTVRIIRIPPVPGNGFEIRVPRSKFDTKNLLENSPLKAKKFSNINSLSVGKLVGLIDPCSDKDDVVPSFYCGGAVLGLTWSGDSRRFFTNTRIYMTPKFELDNVRDVLPTSLLTDRPDLDNTLEIQEWAISKPNTILSRMKGAHGFTTKDCPFYLFLAESPCGEYIASGSEDCGVYIYHIRHKRLMRVLWNGHEDVVSIVSWNPTVSSGCLLASASDDKKICLWSSNCGISVTHDKSWRRGKKIHKNRAQDVFEVLMRSG